MADPVAQYLARHARAEIEIADALDGRWDAAVVVPAKAESPRMYDGLAALGERRALVIAVVNQAVGASPDITGANRALLDGSRALGPCRRVPSALPAHLVEAPRFDLLVVDRATPGNELPGGQGVGLARRIGMDLALALRDRGLVGGRWLYTTDADVELPPGYIDPRAGGDAVALTYPYWHRTDELDDVDAQALELYEISLRYYVLGVGHAGLGCAFSAIGSTMAVAPRAYAEVRGVPLRQAGEDFYLLAKLAKLGPITRPRTAPVAIRGRREIRAPFGTAPAIARIAARLQAGDDFELYAPESFERLATLRAALAGLAAGERFELADPILASAFDAVGGPGLLAQIERVDRPAIRRRQIDQWLDALKTLRLVHELRDAGLADRPWREALAAAPFVDVDAAGDRASIRRAMAEAEDGFLVDMPSDHN